MLHAFPFSKLLEKLRMSQRLITFTITKRLQSCKTGSSSTRYFLDLARGEGSHHNWLSNSLVHLNPQPKPRRYEIYTSTPNPVSCIKSMIPLTFDHKPLSHLRCYKLADRPADSHCYSNQQIFFALRTSRFSLIFKPTDARCYSNQQMPAAIQTRGQPVG